VLQRGVLTAMRGGKTKRSVAGFTAFLMVGVPILGAFGLGAGFLGAVIGGYFALSSDLPKIPDLRAYRPKTVSTFYAEGGEVIGVFYTEKRFPVTLDGIPRHVAEAFLAAEDARFFSHPGVDWRGVVRAVLKNLKAGGFAQGGSTITQQVTRNFLLTKEKTIKRKVREAILSFRLEKTLGKKDILELYLNEVYLGSGAYGVESAARTYFGKTCNDLTVAEAALLGGLVASPNKFSPLQNPKAALERREFVLSSMLRNEFITEDVYCASMDEQLTLRENLPSPYEKAPYFTEAVRRYIVDTYGEDRLYNDGLQVWTTCDLALQASASDSVLEGTKAWERRRQRPIGLVARLKPVEAREFLARPPQANHRSGDLVQAVIVENNTTPPKKGKKQQPETTLQDCTLALQGGARFSMRLDSKVRFKPNDLLEFRVASVNGGALTLEHQTLPPVQSALVCIENRTGYVRALVGGLDFGRSHFNRAVQAKRQPGSAFKPFVYAAAVEWAHYSPQTTIVDEPIAVMVSQREPEWVPMNADGQFLGPISLRQALVQSRNTPTVKLLMDVGADTVIKNARRMGIESPMQEHLSMSLGTAEVSPMELTAAYTVFPNMGVRVHPVLIKKVVDRFGNVLEDNTSEPIEVSPRTVSDEAAGAWLRDYAVPFQAFQQGQYPQFGDEAPPGPDGPGGWTLSHRQEFERPVVLEDLWSDPAADPPQPAGSVESLLSMPLSQKTAKVLRRPEPQRVLSPQTAYLMLSMLRDVCVSGTGAAAARLKRRDIGGKTGTTDDCTDAWFVGFNPGYTTGVWVGYDAKVSLGAKEYGGTAALPIWMSFMKDALASVPSTGYPPPPGISFLGWDGRPLPSRGGLEMLIESGPVLDRAFATKDVSPVDAPDHAMMARNNPFISPGPAYAHMGAAPGMMSPRYGASPYQAATPPGDTGMIRVLSPRGETLGHAPYSQDRRGKMAVHREFIEEAPPVRRESATVERPSDGDRSQQSFLPRAMQWFRTMRDYLPGGNYLRWAQ